MDYNISSVMYSSDSRPFRLAAGSNMEKVVQMDQDLTKVKYSLSMFNRKCFIVAT